ncbi:MAG: hypothetical protein OQJ98_00795 [Candidatus Pacebacteria bacterium]|nr:hypothetical protein [Candidatus Paceibacterota bacterium]
MGDQENFGVGVPYQRKEESNTKSRLVGAIGAVVMIFFVASLLLGVL